MLLLKIEQREKALSGLSDVDAAVLIPDFAEDARENLLDFTEWTYPAYEAGWCHELICSKLDQFLQDVVEKKRAVPYRKHKKEVSHKAGLNGWYAGKYPVKAAGEILKVLDSLEANAESKNLDVERLRIVHAAAQKAREVKRYIPRAMGRSSPSFDHLCHVEFAVEEMR